MNPVRGNYNNFIISHSFSEDAFAGLDSADVQDRYYPPQNGSILPVGRWLFNIVRGIFGATLGCTPVHTVSGSNPRNPRHASAQEVPTSKSVTAGHQEKKSESDAARDISGSEYHTQRDPFGADPRIKQIAREIFELGGDPFLHLFDRLKVGGTEGLVYDRSKDHGKTASQTLLAGGDCSDLGNLAISVIKELNRLGANISGGAYKIHFHNEEPDINHFIPYIFRDGKKVILDLQHDRLGRTNKDTYDLLLDYSTFDQAASLYHSEWGDYYLKQGQEDLGIQALNRALEIYPQDPHVIRNLAAANYNKLSRLAKEAFQQRHWDQCIDYNTQAIYWAGQLPSELRERSMKPAQMNLESCKNNKAIENTNPVIERINQIGKQGSEAYHEKRWKKCVELFSKGLSLIDRLPEGDQKNDLGGSFRQFLRACEGKR